MTNLSKNSIRWFFLTGLGFAVVSALFEILAMFRIEQDWGTILSIEGLLTIVVYIAFFILGLIILFLRFFASPRLKEIVNQFEHLSWMRWPAVAVLILSVIWFYLYSPWQYVLTGPWLQLIFSFGLTTWIAMLISPHRVSFSGWDEIIFVFGLFLFPRIVLEMRVLFTQAWVYRLAVLVGYLMVLAMAAVIFSSFQQKFLQGLISWRNRMGWSRWIVIVAALCGPVLFYGLAGTKIYATNPNIRFSFLLIELILAAILLNKNCDHLISAKTLLIGAFVLALISALVQASLTVTNYPFSIGWSEGDRLYEDSLIFGQHLYNYSGTIVNPYGSPGSYVLWGSLFLFHGVSIELLRLWDVVLGVVFPALAAWILARKIENIYLRLAFVLWLTLFFIVEAPLHPPFMLAAIIVFAFMSSRSFWLRVVSIVVASIYVGLSRWTWIPVTAGWAILIDLILYYPHRTGPFIRRVAPTAFLALAGLLPGLIVGYRSVFSVTAPTTNLTFHQSLLWYRLLPNPTLPLGVLLTAILYSGPLVAILIWWIASGRWQLDWLQLLAIGIGLAGFFIAGLIVSSKIGGGGDLHNLDMYLMTLVLVFMLGLYNYLRGDNVSATTWPVWLQITLCLAVLLPIYSVTPFPRGSASDPILNLPSPPVTQQELTDINLRISQASQQGLVLMVDQRQLLTFNYVNSIPFVPDYEKKYMMDQAMGNNAAYFRNYYQDLANKRFSLIVIEVLRLRRATGAFSDENNDWVDWVSKPTLCFYQPLVTYDDINVQLLIPRQDISHCQMYLK